MLGDVLYSGVLQLFWRVVINYINSKNIRCINYWTVVYHLMDRLLNRDLLFDGSVTELSSIIQWIGYWTVLYCSIDRLLNCDILFDGSVTKLWSIIRWIGYWTVIYYSMDRLLNYDLLTGGRVPFGTVRLRGTKTCTNRLTWSSSTSTKMTSLRQVRIYWQPSCEAAAALAINHRVLRYVSTARFRFRDRWVYRYWCINEYSSHWNWNRSWCRSSGSSSAYYYCSH